LLHERIFRAVAFILNSLNDEFNYVFVDASEGRVFFDYAEEDVLVYVLDQGWGEQVLEDLHVFFVHQRTLSVFYEINHFLYHLLGERYIFHCCVCGIYLLLESHFLL